MKKGIGDYMSIIRSIVDGCSDRVYSNAVKAFLRDPIRPIRLLDFYTKKEKEILLFTSLGNKTYDRWIDGIVKKAIGENNYE